MSGMELFSKEHLITPDEVRRLIDFSPGEHTVRSMAELQSEGVAVLYNYLCRHSFAYLADEVGTGKTYQALGVAALVWHLKPEARILFIAPRQNVQAGWLQEYSRFFRSNYLAGIGGDDRAGSLLLGTPVHSPEKVENLREWLVLLNRPQRVAAFLRHTSFMRPIYTTRNADLAPLWAEWRHRLANLGLRGLPERLRASKREDITRVVNMAFAEGMNRFLGELSEGPTFDLVVMDEAQCLRNPDNQSNSVLHTLLEGRVRKWLFLSATPAHSGVKDIATVLNRYPGCGQVIDEAELNDLVRLQEKLQGFMVRRPRAYVVNGESLTKEQYRENKEQEWAEATPSALATLSMGLVQKRLVPVLGRRSYRYHIGFLSSFESLQSSVRHLEKPQQAACDESGGSGDFYKGHDESRVREDEAPDSGFIDRLAGEFQQQFHFPLPHPKLDRVVKEVARLAFGEEAAGEQPEAPGGEKVLVFTRRISTVDAMRERLEMIYHERVARRVKRCWNRTLDWEHGTGDPVDEEQPDTPLEYDAEKAVEGGRGLRFAMQDKNWLGRFRRTFRDTGRNALFFEENWLQRLCQAGGRDPLAVAESIPDALWAASWDYAAHRSGSEFSQHRAERLHYLALQGVREYPELFGLDAYQAAVWCTALQNVVPSKDRMRPTAGTDPRRDAALFTASTFWTVWDGRFGEGSPLALPGAGTQPEAEALYRRKVLQTIIGQFIRLTDALVDLYCAGPDEGRADRFLDWLTGSDRDARRLHGQLADWIAHLDLILASALGETEPLEKLAGRSHFEQLNAPAPVVGITGGSGGNHRATQQFRTPGYPLVIVCTDTLKEGVNLHLFCDRVVHYGIAWTSGDLEQRIGRVDRYFGRIERRLRTHGGAGPKLEVYYPHIVNSIERDQVKRVIARKRAVDALMDSPLASGIEESREIAVDRKVDGEPKPKLAPFAPPTFEQRNAPLFDPDRETLLARKRAYVEWAEGFAEALKRRGIEVSGNPSAFHGCFQLKHQGRGPTFTWSFDPDLGGYLLRLTPPLGHYAAPLHEAWAPLAELEQDRPGHDALLVPSNPTQSPDGLAERIASLLQGDPPQPVHTPPWQRLKGEGMAHLVEREAPAEGLYVVEVLFGTRRHLVELELSEGLARAVASIAEFDQLPDSGPWDGPLTEENLRRWAKEESRRLPHGAIDLDRRHRLRYAANLVYSPDESPELICRFISLVGERADTYEAALQEEDIF